MPRRDAMRLCVQLCKDMGWGLGDALGLPLDELEEWCKACKDALAANSR